MNSDALKFFIDGWKARGSEKSDPRRSHGVHYTSSDHIHKLIDPLFLDELRAELDQCGDDRDRLIEFQSKLARLTFLDPSCGTGNFLVETFRSLRRIENEIIRRIPELPIRVSIDQFFGIELDDSACTLARTAMSIADQQMLQALDHSIPEQPSKHSARIVCGNALRLDWHSIAPTVDYVIGNPPFVGHQWRTPEQVTDMKLAFHDLAKHGKLDYVCAWFNKVADFVQGTETRAAFVSTNSIVQGESVGILWRHLFDKGIHIDFAHRSFRWANESENRAAVHCVIIGFSHAPNTRPKLIFDGNRKCVAENINGYLIDAPSVFIQNRGKPLRLGLPRMTKGNQPTDGGHLILTLEERDELLRREPRAEKFIRRYVGADDFLNGKVRYCLWLVDATDDELCLPPIATRLDAVRLMRQRSATKSVREAAATPHLFTQYRQPSTEYLLVPSVSSERRQYIPIGFLPPDFVPNHATYTVANADRFIFGVMESSVHMAWMRTICGRLEVDYRYSPSIYNNFPWLEPTEDQRLSIEHSARIILDVRSKHEGATLAALYDETTMPEDLRRAHADNDRAVMDAYGFARSLTEDQIVARLMIMYERMISPRGK